MSEVINWIQNNETFVWAMVAISVATFIGTLISVPLIIIRLPADYFCSKDRRDTPLKRSHPALRLSLIVAKNFLGGVFLIAGLAMLVLPGQGILTALIGLSLIDFPGKFAMERWIVRQERVLRTINWIRRKASREEMIRP